jgi:hypothetical protein
MFCVGNLIPEWGGMLLEIVAAKCGSEEAVGCPKASKVKGKKPRR